MQQYDSVIRPSEMTCTVTIRGTHRSQKPCGVKSQESNCLKNSMIPAFALFQNYRQDRYRCQSRGRLLMVAANAGERRFRFWFHRLPLELLEKT